MECDRFLGSSVFSTLEQVCQCTYFLAKREEILIYFAERPILSDEAAVKLRGELMSYGIFKEFGKKTLVAKINNETLETAREVVELILKKDERDFD